MKVKTVQTITKEYEIKVRIFEDGEYVDYSDNKEIVRQVIDYVFDSEGEVEIDDYEDWHEIDADELEGLHNADRGDAYFKVIEIGRPQVNCTLKRIQEEKK